MNFIQCYDNKIPFVLFSHQGENEMNAIVQGVGHEVFRAHPFSSINQSEEIEISGSMISLEPIDFHPKRNIQDHVIEDIIPRSEQIEILKKTISALNKDDLSKVVISQSKKVHFKRPYFRSLLQALVNADSTAFNYVFYHPTAGIWAGSTPEKLIELQGNQFSTIALAGTRITSNLEDHPWTSKEREEQEIVTEYILEKLEGKCHNVQMNGPQNKEAAHLTHLATYITGVCDIKKNEVIHQLHPTPAVCGIPLDKAREFILENERHQRRYYTGYISLETGRNIFSFVNIRCMNIFDEYSVLYAGAGITASSDAEAEWKECEEKLKVLLSTIQKM